MRKLIYPSEGLAKYSLTNETILDKLNWALNKSHFVVPENLAYRNYLLSLDDKIKEYKDEIIKLDKILQEHDDKMANIDKEVELTFKNLNKIVIKKRENIIK